jgi:hypothetical protein
LFLGTPVKGSTLLIGVRLLRRRPLRYYVTQYMLDLYPRYKSMPLR